MATTEATTTKTKKSKAAPPPSEALATTPTAQEIALAEFLDFGEDEGSGFADNANQDLLIPYLRVLQTNSKACKAPEKGGVGGKPGQFYDVVAQKCYDKLTGVPAMYVRMYVEWTPRDAGGGWVANHDPESAFVLGELAKQPFGKIKLPNGNELIETVYLYFVHTDPATGKPLDSFGVLDFTSMKLKAWKRWISTILMFTYQTQDGRKIKPPLFCHRIAIDTTEESNDSGDFFNPNITPLNGDIKLSMQPPSSEAYVAAKVLMEMVQAGTASIDQSSAAADYAAQEDPTTVDGKAAF